MKSLPASSCRAVVSALLLSVALVRAESVLPPTSGGAPLPAAASNAADGKVGSKALLENAQGSNLPLVKRGPVSARPHLLYRILYADGLLNPQQSEDSSSVVQTASPGVLFEIGDAWTVDYTYSRVIYSNRFFRDENEHAASVAAAYKRDRWAFTGVQRYAKSAPVLVETAMQTPQEHYMTDLNLAVRLGERTELDTTGTISSRYVNTAATNPEWTTVDWNSWEITELLAYEIGARFNVAAGFNIGYDSVKPGADMSHTQPMGRLTWHPTNKLALIAQGGVEQRRFKSGRGGSIENPVYRGTLQYAPLATTKLSVAASRSFTASYFANWATRTSGWTAGLEQRLLQRFYLHTSYAEQKTSYVFTSLAAYLNRNDNVRTLNARLGMPLLRAGALSLIYQHGRNSSTERGFSFTSRQFGAEITYRF